MCPPKFDEKTMKQKMSVDLFSTEMDLDPTSKPYPSGPYPIKPSPAEGWVRIRKETFRS